MHDRIVSVWGFLVWASGKRSLAPKYKKPPAKKGRRRTKKYWETTMKSATTAPKIGATASKKSIRKEFFSELPEFSITVTVLSPSVKS